ncbi:MAG: PKD domain-containing protein, partial [Frankiaceae bacterium]|nr:PKD domain-containing protein [Frankiaceae bacterium]
MSAAVSPRKITSLAALMALVVGLLIAVGFAAAPPASADAADDARPAVQQRTPTDITADGLPTVQIDKGVVWRQVILGNTAFAGGEFKNARPAGAAPGQQLIPRNSLLAYDITTGVLKTDWAPSVNGTVLDMALSPDGAWLYIVGKFSAVDTDTGVQNIARISTSTGAVDRTFHPTLGSTGRAIVVTDSLIYVGGMFTNINGVARSYIGAVTTTGALSAWAPKASSGIYSMAALQDGSRIVAAGTFQTMNNSPVYGLAFLDPSTGVVYPASVSNSVRAWGDLAGFYHITVDADSVYVPAWSYGGNANTEGVTRVNYQGDLVWLEDCQGDSYDAINMNDTVYVASHEHYCTPVNGWPQVGAGVYKRLTAFTKAVMGKNGHSPSGYWGDLRLGTPAPALINYFPDMDPGTYTGQEQAAWDLVGNGQYVLAGGEFPTVNGVVQQGLVRFAVPGIAPSASGPRNGGAGFPLTVSARSSTSARLTWTARVDRDDLTLNYLVQRDGKYTPVGSTSASAVFWTNPQTQVSFVDGPLDPGSTHTYQVTAMDPDGNAAWSTVAQITLPKTDPTISPYDTKVLADGPTIYWPMNEPSGNNMLDSVGHNDVSAIGGVPHGTGPMGSWASAYTNGSANGVFSTAQPASAPDVFTMSSWVATGNTGQVLGLATSPTGLSAVNDRQLYIDKNGMPVFGVNAGGKRTVTGPTRVNNGQWHLLLGTVGPRGMELWVDGVRVGYDPTVTSADDASGYWRFGGDNISSWPNATTNTYVGQYYSGAAIFDRSLSWQEIQKEYLATGKTMAAGLIPSDTYGQVIYNDNPDLWFRLDDKNTTALDATGKGWNGTYSGTVTYGVPSPVTGPTGTGVTFNGVNASVATDTQFNNPTVYSTEAWFKTTTTTGGTITSFSSNRGGTSNGQDRQVYMLDSGQLAFGTMVGSTRQIATSTATYNDGQWHQVVATQGSDGMKLYADGALVASNPATTALNMAAYWRVGGDRAWDQTSGYFAGTIDEFAKYGYALSAAQVRDHYLTAAMVPGVAPTAVFASTASGLVASFNANGSRQDGGLIASYSWDFGDGSPADTTSGATPTHRYRANGTYPVTLTLTSDKGVTGTSTQNVTVAQPLVLGADAFARTAANGWGQADVGGAWTVLGTPSRYRVDAGAGVGLLDSPATSLVTTLNQVLAADVTETAQFSLNAAPTGAGTQVGLVARRVGPSDYRGKVTVLPSGAVQLYVSKVVNNLETTLGVVTVPGLTYTPGDVLGVRLSVLSDPTGAAATLEATVWNAAGPEPAPQLSRIDADPALQGPGAVGTMAYSTNTSTAPTTVTVRNYLANDPSTRIATATPTAFFTSKGSGLTAWLDASGSYQLGGKIASYTWDFGDGSPADTTSGATPTHTYAAEGTYPVTLTVTNDKGAKDSYTQKVSVAWTAVLASDAFARTVANGWGQADTGGAWTVAGAASRYSVDVANAGTGTGIGVLDSPSTSLMMTLNQVFAADVSETAQFSLDAAPGGGTPGGPPAGGGTPGDPPAGGGTPGDPPAGGGTPGDPPAGGGDPIVPPPVAVPPIILPAAAHISLDALPTGAGTQVGLVARRVGSSDYRGKVTVLPTGAVQLYLSKVVNNVETTLGVVTVPGL